MTPAERSARAKGARVALLDVLKEEVVRDWASEESITDDAALGAICRRAAAELLAMHRDTGIDLNAGDVPACRALVEAFAGAIPPRGAT